MPIMPDIIKKLLIIINIMRIMSKIGITQSKESFGFWFPRYTVLLTALVKRNARLRPSI